MDTTVSSMGGTQSVGPTNAPSPSLANKLPKDDLASGPSPYLINHEPNPDPVVSANSSSLANLDYWKLLAINMADFPPESSPRVNPEKMQPHPSPYVDRPQDVTIAIELKYLFPFLAHDATDPFPHDARPIKLAPRFFDKKVLSDLANGLVVETIRRVMGEHAVAGEVIKAAGRTERELWDSHWIVKKSSSPEVREPESLIKEYVWAPVEVISHKFLINDPDTIRRIRAVISAISKRHRILVNYTCDTHVHLGRKDDRAFTLETLQRLATLVWPAEQALRSIRDPRSPNYHNIWTWGFETPQSRLGMMVNGLEGPATHLVLTQNGLGIPDKQIVRAIAAQQSMPAKELTVFQEIWKADSHRALGRLLSGSVRRYRRLGLNFSMFGLEDARSRINPRTMEFRFMEGTYDSDLVANWVLICYRFVELAILKSDDRYETTLGRLLQRIGSGTRDLPTGKERGAEIGREFRELMDDIGISRDVYGSFEKKVIEENFWEPIERPNDPWEHLGWEGPDPDTQEEPEEKTGDDL
ncbi:hypothetical protein QBC38DRAFT_277353 [Podospora fimiseda]|uniref:Uncharacterized protein n=1 Tax=Podospora fimiseda TaxID=252190 RepID=A0AAN7BWM3_9PEZI|nr:hypothetical protein QBC38DRAFT_277353 [Podospora fimiseda]